MGEALPDVKPGTRLLQHFPRKHKQRVTSDLASVITDALEQCSHSVRWRLSIYRSPLVVQADPTFSREEVTRIDSGAATATTDDALSGCHMEMR